MRRAYELFEKKHVSYEILRKKLFSFLLKFKGGFSFFGKILNTENIHQKQVFPLNMEIYSQ